MVHLARIMGWPVVTVQCWKFEKLNLDTLVIINRIRTLFKNLRVIPLFANAVRRCAEDWFIGLEAFQDPAEIMKGFPAKFPAGFFIDIDPVYQRKHLPAPTRIFRFIGRHVSSQDAGSIAAQFCKVIPRERGGGADDIAGKALFRRPFHGIQVRLDCIMDIDAAKQKLVGLGVFIRIACADRRAVVFFGKKREIRSTVTGRACLRANSSQRCSLASLVMP